MQAFATYFMIRPFFLTIAFDAWIISIEMHTDSSRGLCINEGQP